MKTNDSQKLSALYEEQVLKMVNINSTPDDQFDVEELKMGIEDEMEHTDDMELAKSIAKDHLSKNSKYYSELKSLEQPSGMNVDPNKPEVANSEHHCTKNVCPECQDVTTCKCSTPKTNITSDVCYRCKSKQEPEDNSSGFEQILSKYINQLGSSF